MGFECGEVSGWRACIVGIVYQVSSHGKSRAFFFFFMGFELTNEFSVRDGATSGDVGFANEFDGVGAFDAGTDALGQAAEFVGSGVVPGLTVAGVCYELSVLQCAASGFIEDAEGEMR